MCGYDSTAPSSTIDNQTAGNYAYFQNSSLTINATVDTTSETYGSGLANVRLYYWYHNASNNATKENNTAYWSSDVLDSTDSTPWPQASWTFSFPNGSGYYRFDSIAYDNATNAETLLNVNQANNTECFFNNTPPNIPYIFKFVKIRDACKISLNIMHNKTII